MKNRKYDRKQKVFYLIVSQSVRVAVSEKTCSMNFTISLKKQKWAQKKQWTRNTFIGCYLSYLLSSTDSDSAWADVSWNRIAKARMRNRRRSVLEDSICTLFRLDLGRIKADLFSCQLIWPFYSLAQLRVTSKLVPPL